MNITKVALPAARLTRSLLGPQQAVAQRFYSASKGEIAPGYIKIKEKYKKFQVDDGVPVHLKGGPVDHVLYYITLIGCAVGTAMCFEYYYSAAFPKKQ